MDRRRLAPGRVAPALAVWLVLPLGCTANIGAPSTNTPGPSGSPSPSPSTGPNGCTVKPPPITPRLRRLSFSQYDRSVSELVGLVLTPSTQLGAEVDGINAVLWSGIEVAAADAAARAVADPTAYARLVPCTPSGDGKACATQVITALGQHAYRRPLEATETARYTALFDDRATLTPTGSFKEAIQLILEVMLQSPSFLLRVEKSASAQDGKIALSSLEMASRLSYALWNGPPDDELLAAASRGDLDTAAGVRTQAQRMLSTAEGLARARPLLKAEHKEYLGMVGAYGQFWANTQRDPMLFPAFYPGIDVDFREEVLGFMERVVLDKSGSFQDLMTSPTAMVNAKIAPIYGLTGNFGADWTPVELDPATRPGLLTRAGFLGTHGRFSRGSLIFRGAFVLKRLLCQEMGSPPAGADATPLPPTSGELKTTRDRIDALTSPTLCASCHHTRINPAGFPLEVFDGIGAYRTQENGTTIDTSGFVNTGGHQLSFNGPAEYAQALAASSEAQACFVRRFAEFSFNLQNVDLGCDASNLSAKLAEPSFKIKDFYVEFVASDAFRFRPLEEAQ
ncbi:MAG: DUF1592 domain-containing protein [Myxococcota bacterium]